MIYVKSILAGLLALIVVPVCLLVIAVAGTVIYALVHPTPGEGSIGLDPISLTHQNPIAWFLLPLVFFASFIWEYQRLAKWH